MRSSSILGFNSWFFSIVARGFLYAMELMMLTICHVEGSNLESFLCDLFSNINKPDTPARLVFRVLLRLQCWCLVQDVLEVRPAKSVESQLLCFRVDCNTAHVAIDLSLVLLCEQIQFQGVAWPPPRYGVSTILHLSYCFLVLARMCQCFSTFYCNTFSQSQKEDIKQ